MPENKKIKKLMPYEINERGYVFIRNILLPEDPTRIGEETEKILYGFYDSYSELGFTPLARIRGEVLKERELVWHTCPTKKPTMGQLCALYGIPKEK